MTFWVEDILHILKLTRSAKYQNDCRYLDSKIAFCKALTLIAVAEISPQFMLGPRAGSYSLSFHQNKTLLPIQKSSLWLSSAGSD